MPETTGHLAENLACEFLQRHGLILVERNWRSRFGEIDLVLREGKTIILVEVRLRSNTRFGGPGESIDARKRERLLAAARQYLTRFPRAACRFDVILLARLHVQRSTLAGYRYYQAPALAASIQPGASLDLVRESDNPYDANAVRVEWHGYKLGYVPRTRNAALAWAMDHGESVNASVAQGDRPRRIRARLEFDIFLR